MSFGGFFCKLISCDFHATLPGYSVRKIVGVKDGSNNTTMYMTLLFAGVALTEWSLPEKGTEENSLSSIRGH